MAEAPAKPHRRRDVVPVPPAHRVLLGIEVSLDDRRRVIMGRVWWRGPYGRWTRPGIDEVGLAALRRTGPQSGER